MQYVLSTRYSKTAIKAALMRAGFILRKEGLGGIDVEQATILESFVIEDTPPERHDDQKQR